MVDEIYAPLTLEQIEYRIHKSAIDYLDQRVWRGNKIIFRGNPAFENLVFVHIPNARHGKDDDDKNSLQGFFLKQLGVVAGAFDLLLFWPHRNALAYDFKAKNNDGLSTPQKRFRARWKLCGFPSAWGTSTEHLRDTLIKHGAKCMIHSVRPLDLSNIADKHKAAHDFQKPHLPDLSKAGPIIKPGKVFDF